MILDLIKYVVYLSLLAIVGYFMWANLSLMNKTIEVNSFTSHRNPFPETKDNQDLTQIQQELMDYGQSLVRNTEQECSGLTKDIKLKFKKKEEVLEPKVGLLNSFLKSVSPVDKTDKAPDLENFDDYAPAMTGTKSPSPTLMDNGLTLKPSSKLTNPIPINEFDSSSGANFTSELTTPYNNQVPADSLQNQFKHNPFPNFDSLSKADVTDPAQWDQIAKQKENQSPLLSLSCMKPHQSGFMPSNHYDVGSNYGMLKV